jgi:hypothetical protein
MKLKFILLLTIIINCHFSYSQTKNIKTDIGFIKELSGKDALQIKLFDHPTLKERMKNIYGKEYKIFLENMSGYSDPIIIKGDYGYVLIVGKYRYSGNCGIYFDFKKNLIYATIGAAQVDVDPLVFSETNEKSVPKNILNLFN